jgi:hypothetical protein
MALSNDTMTMFYYTIHQYDAMAADDEFVITADELEEFWSNMYEDYGDEDNSSVWATIMENPNTVDWNFIARKYTEKRAIADKFNQ